MMRFGVDAMRKFLLVVFLLGLVVVGGGAAAGYFYLKAHLAELPPLVQGKLKEKGVALSYQRVDVDQARLGLALVDCLVAGTGTPYTVKAERVAASFGFSLSPTPVRLTIVAAKPIVTENP